MTKVPVARAKFIFSKTTQHHGYSVGKSLTFTAEYDTSIEEDRRFCEATPNGTLEMWVNNPRVLAALEPGKAYYMDLIPAD